MNKIRLTCHQCEVNVKGKSGYRGLGTVEKLSRILVVQRRKVLMVMWLNGPHAEHVGDLHVGDLHVGGLHVGGLHVVCERGGSV